MDWLLSTVEGFLALSVCAGVFYCVFKLFFCGGGTIEGAIEAVDNHWKGALLLVVALFYRTVRVWLERIKTGPLGVEAPSSEDSMADNPGGATSGRGPA
jgi:hypothetical protein